MLLRNGSVLLDNRRDFIHLAAARKQRCIGTLALSCHQRDGLYARAFCQQAKFC